MQKNIISSKQAIYIMILFLIGSTAVTGIGSESKQDSWISFIFAIIMSIPLVLIYSRIIKLFPEKNLYDIVYILFGKLGGLIISLIYIFYSFQLGALVVRNFTEYVQLVSLVETPQFILALFMIIICFWLLKNGVELLGRISIIFLPIITIFLVFTIIFLSKDMDISNIKPILGQDLKLIFTSSFSALTFPFGESVLFMMVLSSLHPKESPYKVYISSVLITGIILLAALLRNILVLGIPILELMDFPSYTTASILSIGDFISRIEISVSTSFLFAGIIKICVCLYASTKGIAKVFKIDNYKLIVIPIAFLMIAFSGLMYSNTMQMFEFIKIYKYYAIPFQIILPVIILIFAEIKVRKNKKIAKCEIEC